MFLSPYETTVCRNHRMDDIRLELVHMFLEGELRPDQGRVWLVGDEATQLKPFAHPVILDHPHERGQLIIVGDARSSSRVNRETSELRGGSDFEYLKLRCRLMDLAWVDGRETDLLNAGDFQVRVFARLMSENLGRRMNLSMDTQVRVQVISAHYYIGLFYDEVPEDEEYVLKISKRISRSVGVPVPDVLSIIEEVPQMKSTGDFTTVLSEHGNSVRLEKLKPGFLYTMLGGIWFGANNVENVAVALEHPPTFCAMLQLVLSDRSYRKSILGQLIQRIDRRGELGETFSYHLQRMVSVS
jgi:hypothetical protein